MRSFVENYGTGPITMREALKKKEECEIEMPKQMFDRYRAFIWNNFKIRRVK